MEEKDRLIAELQILLEAKDAIIARLEQRLGELERRLGLNSSNSGKPPHSDGLGKRTLPSREKSNKPSGGQKGHLGTTLMQMDSPDHVVEHRVTACSACQQDLSKTPINRLIKRQVFDIPVSKVGVTEHQGDVKICTCGYTTAAAFPSHVVAPVQYGSNVKSTVVYLANQQMIPQDRLQQTLEDTYGIHLSTQTIASIVAEAAEKLAPHQDHMMEKIKQAPVKHVDETGLRIAKKTQWVHVYSTETETVYDVIPKRKNVVEDMTGCMVHDHWKSYFTWPGVTQHVLCNAHHARELKAVGLLDKEPWAVKMRHLLFKMRERSHQEKGLHIPWMKRCYDMLIEEGLRYHASLAKLAGRKRRPGHNLLLRLKSFKEETLRFLDDKDVPFTNNLAERDRRMIKVKQKVSGGFRTPKGAKDFLIIRGYISTMRKRQQNIFQALQSIMATA
jgi:transposase